MDIADRADQNTELLTRLAINSVRTRIRTDERKSETVECVDCGCIIPKARRCAVPGCIRCVTCQIEHDKRG